MDRYQKLLVIVPAGNARNAALAQGIELATRCGAELLVHAFEDRAAAIGEDTGDAGSWLAATLTQIATLGLKVSGKLISGNTPRDVMLADIIEMTPDLVIKQMHSESVLRRLFSTPEDVHLARFSPAPLMVVPVGATMLPISVVAAIDIIETEHLGRLNERILAEARRMAQSIGAELHLAHVFEPIVDMPDDPSMVVAGVPPLITDELHKIHQQRFSQIASAHGVLASHQHLVIGRIDTSLEELCEKLGSQLIVAGSTSPTGLERFMSGSTSEDLLAHAKQSVMVIKPEVVEAAPEA